MQGYRKSSHTTYLLHYHFVFIPKYRKPILRGDVAIRVRELVREICRTNNIEILKGHVRPEHVHLLLSVPPHLGPSRVMQAIKGKTSHHLLRDFRALRKQFWGRHLWARGNKSLTPKNLWAFAAGRGAQEKTLAELRGQFALDVVPTNDYAANNAWQQLKHPRSQSLSRISTGYYRREQAALTKTDLHVRSTQRENVAVSHYFQSGTTRSYRGPQRPPNVQKLGHSAAI